MAIIYPADDEIHIFSSHAWDYGQRRDGLHRLLTPWIKGIDFRDRSIPAAHPLDTETDTALAYELRDIIAGVDALLIMAGMYLQGRRWMQFEIHVAFALGVPIIPIAWNGQERIPQEATRFAACAPVRWRGDSVREAILSALPLQWRQAFEAKLVWRAEAARIAEEQARRALEARGGAWRLPQAKPAPISSPALRGALGDAFRREDQFASGGGVLAALQRYRRYGRLGTPE
jgi:hypothetical protein